jgi:hypothetical protein
MLTKTMLKGLKGGGVEGRVEEEEEEEERVKW